MQQAEVRAAVIDDLVWIVRYAAGEPELQVKRQKTKAHRAEHTLVLCASPAGNGAIAMYVLSHCTVCVMPALATVGVYRGSPAS
jgi:hypothetical protein